MEQNKIPTTEELFNKYKEHVALTEGHYDYLIEKEEFKTALIEFAKYHVERALKEANKKATMDIIYRDEAYTNEYNQKYVSAHDVERGGEYGNITVNDSSILNSYPLDLIK